MKRLALTLLLLIAVAGGVVLMAGPGAQASPTTYTVNSTADPGNGTCDATECTLREAIAAANANPGADTIQFDIPGAGPHTIQPTSGLPTVTDPVIIDGTSEPDFSGTPIIELDGTNAGAGVDGLSITAGSSTIKGLVVNRFGGDGIELSPNGGNTIAGNYIGTDVTGAADLGNSSSGVFIWDAPSNTIGGTVAGARNVISGNNRAGIDISGSSATGNQVQGNYIGTDVTGAADLGNHNLGVHIVDAPNNTIGGTEAGAGNIISGNESTGVNIEGSGATGNQVQGNYIGTDVTGAADLGNSSSGVWIWDAPSNTIGGIVTGARNVISGNNYQGINISGSSATGNQVQGNYIGTDKNGTADLGNSNAGISIVDAPNNTIGGAVAGAGNIISGNGGVGVAIAGSAATGNLVRGNYIGVDATGTADLGNHNLGVYIIEAPNNTIGGTEAGARNIIAYNVGDGVSVVHASATGNTISRNSIHSNAGKGIENINGGNAELAPPLIDSGGSASGHTDPKCYPCTVEVFSDSEDEGRIYHGSTATNDDATGTWTYAGAVTGPNITATITHADGNTSEFSAAAAYPPPVGGIANLPGASASTGLNYIALAALAAAALAAVTAGGWYARRRWLG